MKKLFLLILFLLSFVFINAQIEPYLKFNDVSISDFKINSPIVDSTTSAVIIHDIGSTDFEANDQGDFNAVFKIHKRILIRKPTAYDLGTIEIQLYTGDKVYQDQLQNFEASTFNLVNGKIEETKIDPATLYKTKYSKHVTLLRYALTNIKPGSIIEYSYTIRSPYFEDLREWSFQSEYPCLWSEYQVMIPPMLSYFTIKHGTTKYSFDSGWQGTKILTPTERFNSSIKYNMSGTYKYALWVMKDVPSFHGEDFITSQKNYINKIEFVLQEINFRSRMVKTMTSWNNTAFQLYDKDVYWKDLVSSHHWLPSLSDLIPDSIKDLQKAKKVFEYVRDNYKSSGRFGTMLSKDLKDFYKNKVGNVADHNLLLTVLLKNEGFECEPVILSTRKNGYPNVAYAIMRQYNYVLARVKIKDSFYLLDASDKHLGFGRLNKYCYNYSARVMDKAPFSIKISPDSIEESKSTVVILKNNKQDLKGTSVSTAGFFESKAIRDQVLIDKEGDKNIQSEPDSTGIHNMEETTSKEQKDYKEQLLEFNTPEITIDNIILDSLKNYENHVIIKNTINYKTNNEAHLYINPIFLYRLKNNPFISTQRVYPVELSSLLNDSYTLMMDIPEGYVIDELPKPISLKLNDFDGSYDYTVTLLGDKIQVTSVLKILKTRFTNEEYSDLRDFFANVIKKQQDVIVLKKK